VARTQSLPTVALVFRILDRLHCSAACNPFCYKHCPAGDYCSFRLLRDDCTGKSKMAKMYLRGKSKFRRILADRFARRAVCLSLPFPVVSFTFDDAPKSALVVGGKILESVGARATYYVSLGLLGSETEVGHILEERDLVTLIAEGHELGCHTYGHIDAWETPRAEFIGSVVENSLALRKRLPYVEFKTFAYPKSGALLSCKYHVGRYFECCRGGGQTTNVGSADLNLLKACFLDRRTAVNLHFIEALIEHNATHCGWLIFATHDIDTRPSQFGCAPSFLTAVAECVARYGGLILPVREACKLITVSNNRSC
jgi:hypothetical protein